MSAIGGLGAECSPALAHEAGEVLLLLLARPQPDVELLSATLGSLYGVAPQLPVAVADRALARIVALGSHSAFPYSLRPAAILTAQPLAARLLLLDFPKPNSDEPQGTRVVQALGLLAGRAGPRAVQQTGDMVLSLAAADWAVQGLRNSLPAVLEQLATQARSEQVRVWADRSLALLDRSGDPYQFRRDALWNLEHLGRHASPEQARRAVTRLLAFLDDPYVDEVTAALPARALAAFASRCRPEEFAARIEPLLARHADPGTSTRKQQVTLPALGALMAHAHPADAGRWVTAISYRISESGPYPWVREAALEAAEAGLARAVSAHPSPTRKLLDFLQSDHSRANPVLRAACVKRLLERVEPYDEFLDREEGEASEPPGWSNPVWEERKRHRASLRALIRRPGTDFLIQLAAAEVLIGRRTHLYP